MDQLTGRKGRIVSTGGDGVQYEKRSENLVPVDMINLTEKEVCCLVIAFL